MNKIIALITTVCLLMTEFVVAQDRDLIPWARDFREATEFAARQRKLVLIHFWSDDCPPCRRVEANVFTQPQVAAATAASFVPVKVHVEREPELARRYQVTRWPTDVIVNPAGLEVFRTVSPQDPAKYMAMLTEVASQSGSQLARAATPAPVDSIRSAAEQQPATNPATTPTVAQNGPYQPLTGARPAETQPSPSPYQNPTPYQNNASAPADAPAGGYVGLVGAGDTKPAAPPTSSPTESAPPSDPYANRLVSNPYLLGTPDRAAPSPKTADGGDFQPPAAGEGSPSPKTGNEPATSPAKPELANNTPEKSPVLRDTTTEPKREPTASPNLPPLGLEGYCVVTLTEQTAWKKGDKKFGAIHRGKLYLFTGEAEQKTFLADPDRFSPALSGFDPVQFAENGKLVEGRRAHGLTYNRQMFLFTDEASLQKFQGDPRRYADSVYQAQLKADGGTKFR